MPKAALFSLILLAWPVGAAAAKPPVLVELFTAQGCASCADANPYFAKLADRPGVLALTFSVDYWDYLGWTDTFARPEFTERQKAYVTRLKLREPYTPQIVIEGREQAQGLKTAEVDRLVRAAAAAPKNPPDIRFVGARRVDVGSGRAGKGGADVWLIRYDPRAEVQVRAGDNRGETVVQKNVVRQMERLGAWRGRPQAYRIPPMAEEGLKTAIVVQQPRGGRVLGVAEPRS
ncbi:MAG: DUF1223 domain-containing protein [Phenylobacterium sp.]|uniref:DUF1223 domain-containing protein n=1 Tax=Phenylobacterium sp. TaxID=1871053 RepID=UPI001A63610E|nr:DUF1223 domain-containing protein [Phenylobacterium sp.]MBL8554434.1 DUF1223 domain-containing protein [Phenylobacterium sp.]